jgi:hypothetical protein
MPSLGTCGDHLESLKTWMTPFAKFRDSQISLRKLKGLDNTLRQDEGPAVNFSPKFITTRGT